MTKRKKGNTSVSTQVFRKYAVKLVKDTAAWKLKSLSIFPTVKNYRSVLITLPLLCIITNLPEL